MNFDEGKLFENFNINLKDIERDESLSEKEK
jgi:hypothetical protein